MISTLQVMVLECILVYTEVGLDIYLTGHGIGMYIGVHGGRVRYLHYRSWYWNVYWCTQR